MELTNRVFIKYKTKKYFKRTHFFFIFSGVNKTSKDWIPETEQGLKNLNFSCYKNFNKIVQKTLKKSTYQTLIPVIKGPIFFIKYDKKSNFKKQLVTENFQIFLFVLLSMKFNNRQYSVSLLKKMNSLKYKNNNMLFYQFYLTNLKYLTKISK